MHLEIISSHSLILHVIMYQILSQMKDAMSSLDPAPTPTSLRTNFYDLIDTLTQQIFRHHSHIIRSILNGKVLFRQCLSSAHPIKS